MLERWIKDGDTINWVGIFLVGIAILSLPLGFGASSMFATHGSFPGQAVFAVALLVIGVLLYRGTFDDRASPDPDTPPDLVGSDADVPQADLLADPGGDESDRGVGPAGESNPDDAILVAAYSPIKDDQPKTETSRPVRPKSILGRAIIAALLIVVGLIAIVDNWWLSVGAAQYFAAALVVIGIGLLIGAWRGRARATIFLGIPLLLLLQLSSVFHVPVSGGFGDPLYSPSTVGELQSEYRLSAGELVLDLRGMDFVGEETVVASVGAGELIVWLPNDVDAIVRADALAGEVEVQGRFESGLNVSLEREIRLDDPRGTIVLDLDVVFGLVTVLVEPPDAGQDSGGD